MNKEYPPNALKGRENDHTNVMKLLWFIASFLFKF